METSMPQVEWRCRRCGGLLGVARGGRIHLKHKRAQFVVRGEVLAVCPHCAALNETQSDGEPRHSHARPSSYPVSTEWPVPEPKESPMNTELYSFRFNDKVSMSDVRESLVVAVITAEGIHGRMQVQLDARVCLDLLERFCLIDGATLVSRTIANVFTLLLFHELGEGAFTAERKAGPQPQLLWS